MSRLLHALRSRNVTQAWLLLVTITVATAAVAVAERGALPWIGWLIAALVTWKASLVAEHYLEITQATPLFRRIVQVFIGVAPLALAVTAWLESRG
jgi:hypothetical protein